MDPHRQRSSSASYALHNLYRNIFINDDEKGLSLDLGESCRRDSQKNLICVMKKDLKWSDGSPLTAGDFLQSYQKILTPTMAAPRADLLFSIKNAQAIYSGKMPMSALGIKAVDKRTLKFEFQSVDSEFEYNLAGFLTAPSKEASVFSGPYKLKEWQKGRKILLEGNDFYPQKNAQRPPVEFLFIEEDSVALQLYEKNELQFLRRLPTLFIPTFKKRPDFVWQPVIRMDYIGFGPELKDKEDLRKAFTYSLNFIELQKIFSSEGRPGCLGLPDSWFPTKAPCQDFDLKKVPPVTSTQTFTMIFSALGGEDHKRATEWLQDQWKKHAGLKTQLEVKENKVYLQQLQNSPPALFRKGVAPDRPTCLAALQTFGPMSTENFLRLKSSAYDKILDSLAKAKTPSEQKKWCLSGAEYLLKNHLMIPLGAIHFAMLAKTDFIGWKLNQLNQLDLSMLQSRP